MSIVIYRGDGMSLHRHVRHEAGESSMPILGRGIGFDLGVLTKTG